MPLDIPQIKLPPRTEIENPFTFPVQETYEVRVPETAPWLMYHTVWPRDCVAIEEEFDRDKAD